MTDTVWVVLAEEGDYSEREVWVGGVFRTCQEAEDHVLRRMAASREWREWQQRRNRINDALAALHKARTNRNLWDDREAAQKIAEQAVSDAGPEPEREDAERCQLVEVPIGVWFGYDSQYEKDAKQFDAGGEI